MILLARKNVFKSCRPYLLMKKRELIKGLFPKMFLHNYLQLVFTYAQRW